MLKALVPSAVLLITPFNVSLFAEKSCLNDGFYGSFGGQSVFNVTMSCLEVGIPALDSGVIVSVSPSAQQLVWVQKEAIDDGLQLESTTIINALDQLFTRLSAPLRDNSGPGDQQVFVTSEFDNTYEILHRTPSSALLSVSPDLANVIDISLPRFYKSTLLQTAPYVPVPPSTVDYVKGLLSSLKFDPVVASIVNSISVPGMKRDIRYLTGEDEESPIVSRHSFAVGSRIAAAWLKDRFEEMGATCELKHFRVGFAPNVIWYVNRSFQQHKSFITLSFFYSSQSLSIYC